MKEIWKNSSGGFDILNLYSLIGAPLGLTTVLIGLTNRGLNEIIYRGFTKPLAQARLNKGLKQFMQSERIPIS